MDRNTRVANKLALPTLCLLALAAPPAPGASPGAREQGQPPAVREALTVVEKSILLQRSVKTEAVHLEVLVGGALGEAVAVYPLAEVEFPTTLYVDLCGTSLPKLVPAVVMLVESSWRLRAKGPVALVASGAGGSEVLLEPSRDPVDIEAALASLLWKKSGRCEDPTPQGGLDRLREALDRMRGQTAATSLLIVHGLDHQKATSDEITRFRGPYGRAGEELAAAGRTTVVLAPHEGESRLREEELRPFLGDPDGPPRAIDLNGLAGWIAREKVLPDDPRLFDLAVDPRSTLLKELVAPGRGRVFAFRQQLEAFSADLGGFHVLFYRIRLREGDRRLDSVPIEVRTRRSGDIVRTARVVKIG